MKKILTYVIVLFLLSLGVSAMACDVCKRQQPKLLKEVSHGTGPQGQFDYLIVGATMLIVLITLFYSVKMMIRPMEKKPLHIKRLILNDGQP